MRSAATILLVLLVILGSSGLRCVRGNRKTAHTGRGWFLRSSFGAGRWRPNTVSNFDKFINTNIACAKSSVERSKFDCSEHCRKECKPYYQTCDCKGRECFNSFCRTATDPKTWRPYREKVCTCRCSSCAKPE